KSEFLANMSHELRTPLNSLLLLSTILIENRKSHLDENEISFVRTIHNAGTDLLNLINDILDLSKVEAGKLDLVFEHFRLRDLLSDMETIFRPQAEAKKLGFHVELAADLPASIHSDRQRLGQ